MSDGNEGSLLVFGATIALLARPMRRAAGGGPSLADSAVALVGGLLLCAASVLLLWSALRS